MKWERVAKATDWLLLNWQTLLLKLAVVVVVLAAAFGAGVSTERIRVAKAEATEAKEQLNDTIDEINRRLPQLVEADKINTKRLADIASTQEKFNAEVDAGGNVAGCGTTDSELQYLREIEGK